MIFASDTSVACPSGMLADAFIGCAFHGIHIGEVAWDVRSDGSRLDPFMVSWPIESTEWEEHTGQLIALTTSGRIPIIHGDGRWVVFAKHADRPWTWGGLIPLAGVWSDRGYAVRDRANSAESHGDDKWIGTLPEGVPLKSKQADAFEDQMVRLYEARRVMLVPFGGMVKRDEAMAQNWQIFREIIEQSNKDAARILLGQDGSMIATGGDYKKSAGMFGVRNDIIESDLATIGACLSTGLLRPWSLINHNRWDRLSYRWLMPDADEDARRDSLTARRKALWEDITAARAADMVVDQAYVDARAAELGVMAPRLRIAVPNGDDAANDEGRRDLEAAREAQAEHEAALERAASVVALAPQRLRFRPSIGS